MAPVEAFLPQNAAKLLILILNALHGLLEFYQRDHQQLNVDGLFGLRVL